MQGMANTPKRVNHANLAVCVIGPFNGGPQNSEYENSHQLMSQYRHKNLTNCTRERQVYRLSFRIGTIFFRRIFNF